MTRNDCLFFIGLTYMQVLLIDKRVPDYRVFVDSVNRDTLPIVYLDEPTLPLPPQIERMGIVSILNESKRFGPQEMGSMILMIREHGIKYLDFLACNTLQSTEWIEYLTTLERETGVVIGASNDRTGNLKYGGDWILESTGEDIEPIYFTEKIEYYKYLLDRSVFSMVLKSDNTLWGIGKNLNVMFGATYQSYYNTWQELPLPVPKTTTTVKYIACGITHAILLMEDETLWGIGSNDYGQLGITPSDKFTKMNYPWTDNIKSICCGHKHTLFLTESGKVYGIGSNHYGQLGQGLDIPSKNYGYVLLNPGPSIGPVVQIACGNDTTVLLTETNEVYQVWVCGRNVNGELGTGSVMPIYTLVNIPFFQTLVHSTPIFIGCGEVFTVVLMNDGSIYSAGQKEYLGIGDINTEAIITNFVLANRTTSINTTPRIPFSLSVGNNHATVLMNNDRTVWGIGNNFNGEMGPITQRVSTYTEIPSPIQNRPIDFVHCGYNHTLFLTGGILRIGGSYGELSQVETKFDYSNITHPGIKPEQVSDLSLNGVKLLPNMFYPKQSITNIDPSSGPNNSNTDLKGENLFYTEYVQVGDKLANAAIFGNELLKITLPNKNPNVNDNVSVLIVDYTGAQHETVFTYANPLINTAPTSGANNQDFVIEGINLQNTSYIDFGNGPTNRITEFIDQSNAIEFKVPPGTGTVNVSVYDIYGNVAPTPDPFEYTNATLTGLIPSSGPSNSPLFLSGSNLSDVSYVQFGDRVIPNASLSKSNTSVGLIIPAGSGEVNVSLHDIWGNTTGLLQRFNYANPTITSIDPSTAPSKTIMTISGANLQNTSYVQFLESTNVSFTPDLIQRAGSISTTSFKCLLPVILDTSMNVSVYDIYGNIATNTNNLKVTSNNASIFMVPIVDASGNLYALGNNFYGEAGRGDRTPLYPFTQIHEGVSSVGTTRKGMLFIKNKEVYYSGNSENGELGSGILNTTTATRNPSLSNIVQLSAGLFHSLFLNASGKVFATGRNTFGELGLPSSSYSTPVEIPMDNDVVITKIKVGFTHSVMLNSLGEVYTFGNDSFGQLGRSVDTITPSTVPIIVPLSKVTDIACGNNHTLFLEDGYVYSCGLNTNGQLGYNLPTGITFRSLPTFIPGLINIVSISAAGNRSAALDCVGNLWIWGFNHSPTPTIVRTQVSYVNLTYMGDFYVSDQTYYVLNCANPAVPDGILINNLLSIQSDICFLADTPISTDQGEILIVELKPNVHTIRGKKIVAITETYSTEKVLIVIEKDALFPSSPNRRTVISSQHKIFYGGTMVEAYRLLSHPGISTIPYNQEKLYNVLLEEHGRMKVCNMIVETLDPENVIGQIFKEYQRETDIPR